MFFFACFVNYAHIRTTTLWCRFFANRPLFAHQLGTGAHSSSIHSGHLSAHEMDRRRALHFFYGSESLYRNSALGGSPTLWFELGLAQFMESAAYFQDASVWIACVFACPLLPAAVCVRVCVFICLLYLSARDRHLRFFAAVLFGRWISLLYFVFLPSTAVAAFLSEHHGGVPSMFGNALAAQHIELTECKTI